MFGVDGVIFLLLGDRCVALVVVECDIGQPFVIVIKYIGCVNRTGATSDTGALVNDCVFHRNQTSFIHFIRSCLLLSLTY